MLSCFFEQKARLRYDELEKDQIRLLELHPGNGNDRLVCTLRTVDLLAYDDIGATSSIKGLERYEAISYVWGQAKDTIEIECKPLLQMFQHDPELSGTGNGLRSHVTKNLAHALQAFRHSSMVRVLWADALCINQKDTRERAQQVRLMGLIYWKAFRVLVWLGQDDVEEELHRAKHAIRVIKELAHVRLKAFGTTAEQHLAFRDIVFEEPDKLEESEWTALQCLFERPWFERVWVVQEQGLARNVVFHCGQQHFTRTEMEDFTSILDQSKEHAMNQHNMSSQMLRLGNNYWRSCWSNVRLELGSDPREAETFLDILGQARSLSCTDPRDSIYAFLGHPSAFKRHMLDVDPYEWYPRNWYSGRSTIVTPDYRRSNTCLSLYRELAVAAIAERGIGLNVLSHVAHTTETIDLKYPSWVPRWDIVIPTYFIGCGTYFAASGSFSSTMFELSSSKRNKPLDRLSFKAWRLDSVRCVRSIPVTEHLDECLDVMALLLSDAPKMRRPNAIPIPSSLSYPYEEPFVLAFASTMTAGLTTSFHLPCGPADELSEQLIRNFHAYYRHKHLPDSSPLSDAEVEHARYFEGDIRIAASRRLLFITHDGRLGLGPPIVEGSDQIWIPVGAKMPIILRPYADGRFKVIGQTYVYGVMRGEFVASRSGEDAELVHCF